MAISSALTWSPASVGGKSAAVSEVAKRPSGSRTSSEAMCAKHVEDTRHSDLPFSLAVRAATAVFSDATTSWKPASTCPAVRCSNCFPACNSKQPSGIMGATALPERVHTVRPGNRLLPWTCVEIKILRRVRAGSPRRPPRHRRDACSMAWRCRFLTARPIQHGRVIPEK